MMSTSLGALPAGRCGNGPSSLPDCASASSAPEAATRLERFLPLAILTTAVVVVSPVALVALVLHSRNPLMMLAATALAMALSIAFTSAGAAVWKRWPGSRDVVFAELMVWGWARRYWTERRLGRERMLYESARRAGPSVSIELIERLSRLLEARDASTHGHSRRVARHAGRIAWGLHLSAEESAKVRTAAAVHDVGKLYTPRAILENPGFLSDEEYRVLKRHPVDGAEMLADVGDAEITAMVRHHHERLDGSGYPDGLAGEEIPLGARIIAVADTFDAITSDRVYRSARTHKTALDILSKEAGSQLDGAVVAAFLQCYAARRPAARLAFASAASQRALAWLQASSATIGLTATGIAPILPAAGAAGVLALSHGSHDGALAARRLYPPATAAQARALAVFAPATPRQHEATPSVATRTILQRPDPARARETPAARTPTAQTPSAPATANTPTSPASAPVATPAAETHIPASEAPAAPAPPAGVGTPAAPTPPTGSSPPAAQTPASPAPPLTVPTSTPSVTIPSKELSTTTPIVTVSAATPTITAPTVKVGSVPGTSRTNTRPATPNGRSA